MKILTILSNERYKAIVPVVEENELAHIFHCVEYANFAEVNDIIKAHKDSADALLFSGSLLKSHYLSKHPGTRIPAYCFEHNYLQTALHLIRHCVDYPEIPLQSTFCDNLNNVTNYEIFGEVLNQEQMPKTFEFYSFSDEMYKLMAEYVLRLYRSGEVQMSYLTISSLYESISAAGYPCKLLPIRRQDILSTLQRVMEAVSQNKMISERVLLATIDYSFEEELSFTLLEYREATLTKTLVDYKLKYNQPDLTITKMQDRLEVYMQADCDPEVPYMVFDGCLTYIKEHFAFPVTIGIGLSQDVRSSRNDSLLALQYAFDYGGHCTFGKEDDTLTGPIGEERCLVFSTALIQLSRNVAKELGIDSINYVRTMVLLAQKDRVITSDLLARYLNVTVRAASRIVLIMLEKGMVEEVALDSTPRKGRPTKHYRFRPSLNVI